MQIKSFNPKILLIALKSALASLGFSANAAEVVQIHYPLNSQASFVGPAELFTGDVKVDMLFPANDTAHYSGAYVTFQPGARTAWHQHPAGQHMVVTEGTALTGTRDGRIIEFHKGETVWCPKDLDHWHGATPDKSMTHLVITGSLNGENVVWKEKVSDEAYFAGRQPQTTPEVSLDALTSKQQAMVPVAAFTASGDLSGLKKAVSDGLDMGLTVNEIKEIQMHLYAYSGFPRSLNALATTMTVVEERKARGVNDPVGKEIAASVAPGDSQAQGIKVQTELVGKPVTGPLFDFAPYSNVLLQKHLFGDLFARNILDFQERELSTVAALANMENVAPQLKSHIGIALNVGLSLQQLQAISTMLDKFVNQRAAGRLEQAIQQTVKETVKDSAN
ncbi:carboxymuconolactone decarboxylase family protein [Thiomicrorhabdus sp. 6S3-12]|uniref:(R)-mandelonitrile lyase n=1 Tax=Thiomicrorhabdus sp. 6S3-12 TaxID=2819681 RepID=UPI001AAD987F|nr:carboxymuconolactone decarboxylase family protein [Thiomicrorhabdus sp. 6S3-12]MBO1923764.1 carboxymuconolactone decarboxylase family protein [Thiomicrorhabdus sp. 6S3-12]